MPRQDRTGPRGAGPMTGRGMGQCGLGMGWRRGAGQGQGQGQGWLPGRGMGRYFGWAWPQDPKTRKQALLDYKQALQEEIEDLDDELNSADK